MERMREHVFKEADRNKDGLISYEEFLEQTKREEFNRDPGWDTGKIILNREFTT